MTITDINGTVKLNNGVRMPYLGLGVFQAKNGKDVIDKVSFALNAGYRHIDTAAVYGSEEGVGEAIAASAVAREEVFVTSKVWNAGQGYDETMRAFHTSLLNLKTGYLDLYLVHWAVKNKYRETWKAMETLYREGKIRAIGVSDFMQADLEKLIGAAEIVPMINQIEFHPYFIRRPLLDFCITNGIQYESWYPLTYGEALEAQLLKEIAARYKKTVAKLLLRWNLQNGVVIVPRSSKRINIISNADLFDFQITQKDMGVIDGMDRDPTVWPGS
jgi:diketogulonate reductase-like aldo/keto reductase